MKRFGAKLFIEDIQESMDKIERYVKKLDFEAFQENEMLVDAVIRNLEIIGETARNIPQDVRERHPLVPWKRMIGLRNIMIHAYFGVDLSIIWKIVTTNLPETKPSIMELLNEMDEK